MVSRSQALSASVRNVAFSGYCQQMNVKAAQENSGIDVRTTHVIHVEKEYDRDDDRS